MMNMYEMEMLMIWDMNSCLTPRGVTVASKHTILASSNKTIKTWL
jgi:hypothetical protein